jgi:hypothetical protein
MPEKVDRRVSDGLPQKFCDQASEVIVPVKPGRISHEPTRRADILRISQNKNLRLSPNEIPGANTSSRGIVYCQ